MTHELVHFHDQHATTTSLIVAEKFGKRHTHVLRDIEKLIADCRSLEADRERNFASATGVDAERNFGPTIAPEGRILEPDREPNFGPTIAPESRILESDREPNFAFTIEPQRRGMKSDAERNFALMMREVPGPKGAIRQEPYYEITRDGFSLLVMGFTGKEALAWKLKFIAAFNALEAEVLSRQQSATQWERSHVEQAKEFWFELRPHWKRIYELLIRQSLEPKAIAAQIGRSVSAVRRAIHRMIEVGILHPCLVYEAIRTSAFARQLARSGIMSAWGGKVRQLDLFA